MKTSNFRCGTCGAALVHLDDNCPQCGRSLAQSYLPSPPKCSLCGTQVAASPTTLLQDLLDAGASVTVFTEDVRKVSGLNATTYHATLCEICNRIVCYECHDHFKRGTKCAACGGDLIPLSTDSYRSWSAK